MLSRPIEQMMFGECQEIAEKAGLRIHLDVRDGGWRYGEWWIGDNKCASGGHGEHDTAIRSALYGSAAAHGKLRYGCVVLPDAPADATPTQAEVAEWTRAQCVEFILDNLGSDRYLHVYNAWGDFSPIAIMGTCPTMVRGERGTVATLADWRAAALYVLSRIAPAPPKIADMSEAECAAALNEMGCADARRYCFYGDHGPQYHVMWKTASGNFDLTPMGVPNAPDVEPYQYAVRRAAMASANHTYDPDTDTITPLPK